MASSGNTHNTQRVTQHTAHTAHNRQQNTPQIGTPQTPAGGSPPPRSFVLCQHSATRDRCKMPLLPPVAACCYHTFGCCYSTIHEWMSEHAAICAVHGSTVVGVGFFVFFGFQFLALGA